MSDTIDYTPPRWLKQGLLAISTYYLLCGISAIFFPGIWYWAAAMPDLGSNVALHVIGGLMLGIAVGSFGCWISPMSQWSMLCALLAANVFDFVIVAWSLWTGTLPLLSGLIFALFDTILCLFLIAVISEIFRWQTQRKPQVTTDLNAILQTHVDGSSDQLGTLSEHSALFLFFIRHTGCTFCREALDRLSGEISKVKERGARLVVVSMSSVESTRTLLQHYDLNDALVISDPEGSVYETLGLKRGSVFQVLGPKEIWRALRGSLFKYGIGKIEGDPFQLSGWALVHNRRVIEMKAAESASEYCSLT